MEIETRDTPLANNQQDQNVPLLKSFSYIELFKKPWTPQFCFAPNLMLERIEMEYDNDISLVPLVFSTCGIQICQSETKNNTLVFDFGNKSQLYSDSYGTKLEMMQNVSSDIIDDRILRQLRKDGHVIDTKQTTWMNKLFECATWKRNTLGLRVSDFLFKPIHVDKTDYPRPKVVRYYGYDAKSMYDRNSVETDYAWLLDSENIKKMYYAYVELNIDE